VGNHTSARVMEKAGFHREGVLRRWMVLPGFGDAPRGSIVHARTR
jgi:RimJ/RimL family protein N-acetyltransferase